MKERVNRYSQEELDEFEGIVREKLRVAKKELSDMKRILGKKNDSDPMGLPANINLMEGGMEALEKENMSQLATRQQKFIKQLEAALVRIKNKSLRDLRGYWKAYHQGAPATGSAHYAQHRGEADQTTQKGKAALVWVLWTLRPRGSPRCCRALSRLSSVPHSPSRPRK